LARQVRGVDITAPIFRYPLMSYADTKPDPVGR
jgi:hypothetical protein